MRNMAGEPPRSGEAFGVGDAVDPHPLGADQTPGHQRDEPRQRTGGDNDVGTLAQHDAVLALYHDQGLPVLKHLGFGRGVNVTLGLPIVRTSVDHGTALPLAGTGRVELGSFEAAIAEASRLAAGG